VIGYAMSRLDEAYLALRHCRTWKNAYAETATALGINVNSVRLLRDEFDPIHANPRRGWLQRQLRPSRQRILDELQELSSEALGELVSRILMRDEDAVREAIDSLAVTTRVAYNVAERLLTGRRAEEYFLAHCYDIVGVEPRNIVDVRDAAVGFDFAVRAVERRAIEVKGLKALRGDIQFTDREWSEARFRADDYWLVVVGGITDTPTARMLTNPCSVLDARCAYQRAIRPVWRASISVRG